MPFVFLKTSSAMDQLQLPFEISKENLSAFLDTYIALEEEMDRLKAEMLLCKAQYETALPMRAVLVALKVVRARRKLECHPKEPLSLPHQALLESLVHAHFNAYDAAIARLVEKAEGMSAHAS